ncbi:MAG: hypothetical protein CM1200mP4_1720 [Rhodospirillaceae bacterium]|nr:MAG: hypothetical protein CM1200mP4_1720 [Rhodospirillaceae bacterium]
MSGSDIIVNWLIIGDKSKKPYEFEVFYSISEPSESPVIIIPAPGIFLPPIDTNKNGGKGLSSYRIY